jgi:hypothetical protein
MRFRRQFYLMEVVAMGCDYEYLPVPATEAKRAWYDFHSRNPRTPDLASVAFIPARGGSFVVLTEPGRRGWVEALRPVYAVLGVQPGGAVLESFRRYLTEG